MYMYIFYVIRDARENILDCFKINFNALDIHTIEFFEDVIFKKNFYNFLIKTTLSFYDKIENSYIFLNLIKLVSNIVEFISTDDTKI